MAHSVLTHPHRSWTRVPLWTILVLTVSVLLPQRSGHIFAANPGSSSVAQVRFIYRGLGVQPPRLARHAGRVKELLYDQYGLRTQTSQKASIGFADGTVLHLNTNTDATISAHVTDVRHGEVAQYLAAGTNHRVRSNAAVAAAIGTTYDVRIDGDQTVFVVLHGALQVSNSAGAVVVKSNHQTSVLPQGAPLPPSPVDAKAVFAWTDGIPAPDLGEDVALDANGGQIVSSSSQRNDASDVGHVSHINDGLLTQGWETAEGKVRNQQVTVGFFGGNFYRISDVIIDPAATGGAPSGEDLRDFAIRVSSTGTSTSSFTTVFQGTCKRQNTLQHFHLPVAVRARYVQLVALNNYGSTHHLAVAEWEVVATASLFARPFGIAVNSAGAAFVVDSNSDRVDKLSPSGRIVAHFGSKGDRPGQFLRPQGLALDRQGNVYVADTYNSRVQKFSPRGKLLARWGINGLHWGEFLFPRAVAVDGHGAIYVSDIGGDIQKLSSRGRVLARWTGFGAGVSLADPAGLAVDRHDNLYIADSSANRIYEVSPQGKLLRSLGSSGTDPGQFNRPTALCVDRAGTIFVADSFNNRIQRIDLSGHATTYGQFGFARGEFFLPEGITVDTHGNLLVADSTNGRVQKLNSTTGKVRAVWGKSATLPQLLIFPADLAVDGHGNVYVTDQHADRIQVRAPDGHVAAILGYHGYIGSDPVTSHLGQFDAPMGIAIDNQDEIYVADSTNSRIQELSPRGPIGAIGGFGSGPTQFRVPYGVAVDASRNIYVLDTINFRVQKLSPDGTLLLSINLKPATSGAALFLAQGIALDRLGNIFVSSSFDDRILKFGPEGTLLASWGAAGMDPNDRFYGPEGLFVDVQNHLWVANSGHGTVEELDSATGTVMQHFTMPGVSSNPDGITVDGHGFVYVSDSFASRIVKFSSTGKVLAIWT